MVQEPMLCEHCLSDNELRLEVQDRGTVQRQCPICRQNGGRALLAADVRINRIFRALVRLNFSECDYNEHVGADESLEALVFHSRAIFKFEPGADQEAFEEAFSVLADDWYPSAPEEISLGGGYWDGVLLDGIRARRDSAVEQLAGKALTRNWFEVASEAQALLSSLRTDITQTIPAGAEYCRARIGVKARLKQPDVLQGRDQFHYVPFTGPEIDRPPVAKVTDEGRFNRAHVSILYLATDIATAVAELRPHPGHLVSTARFRLRHDLQVANFAHHDIRNFLSDTRLEDLRRILSVADLLDLPVQPQHRVLYLVTQLFSDAVRTSGFSGLTFNSSVAAGTNLTCFIADAFEMVPGSESVQEVVSLQYQAVDQPLQTPSYDRRRFSEDQDSPLATLTHGMAQRGRRG